MLVSRRRLAAGRAGPKTRRQWRQSQWRLPAEAVITLLWNGCSLWNGIREHLAVAWVITLLWIPHSRVFRPPDCHPGRRSGSAQGGSLRAPGCRWQPPASCSAPPAARPIGDAMAGAMREPQRASVREDAWAPREHPRGVHPRARTEHRRTRGHASADRASSPGRFRPAKGWLICEASVSLQVRVAWGRV